MCPWVTIWEQNRTDSSPLCTYQRKHHWHRTPPAWIAARTPRPQRSRSHPAPRSRRRSRRFRGKGCCRRGNTRGVQGQPSRKELQQRLPPPAPDEPSLDRSRLWSLYFSRRDGCLREQRRRSTSRRWDNTKLRVVVLFRPLSRAPCPLD